MRIRSVHAVPCAAAYYFDDQSAIKAGATQDGFLYLGAPQTAGFRHVRQPGESISILMELDSGQWVQGDCCAVQYSGAGGRDPLLETDVLAKVVCEHVADQLIDRDCENFLTNAQFLETLTANDRPLHTALRYGISQALLAAAALAHGQTMTEVICRDYSLPIPTQPVPRFAQSGDDRYGSVDKMLLRRVEVLPHALINNVDEKLGAKGERLLEYVEWLRDRIDHARDFGPAGEEYRPTIHVDVYGTIGMAFGGDIHAIAHYLERLGEVAGPYPLYVEGPIDAGDKHAQIDQLSAIRTHLAQRTANVKIVADEWCNTAADINEFATSGCCDMVQIKTPDLGSVHNIVEAVIATKAQGVEAYQGGSCNETDIAARCCTQIALACQPDRLLTKPGMGVDEGIQIVTNEMWRTLARLAVTRPQG